jgi:hypothetical protein
METMNISLPEPLKAFVEAQKAGYSHIYMSCARAVWITWSGQIAVFLLSVTPG